LIYGPEQGPWHNVDELEQELELATLSWAYWFNADRVTTATATTSADEFEAAFHAAQQTAPTGVGNQ